jgi:hypothetical protein
MAVQILTTGQGLLAPVLACDHCGNRIADEAGGIVLWFEPEATAQPGSTAQAYHLHRECQYAFEAEHKSVGLAMTASLGVHFHYLLHNIAHDPQAAQAEAEDLAQL